MTKPTTQNQLIGAALRHIGQGLLDLADVLVSPGSSAEPSPRPEAPRKPQPPAEEPAEQTSEESEEIKLKDLQEMAHTLLKKQGGRKKLRGILEAHELETVSSAPEKVWPDLKNDLKLAISE